LIFRLSILPCPDSFCLDYSNFPLEIKVPFSVFCILFYTASPDDLFSPVMIVHNYTLQMHIMQVFFDIFYFILAFSIIMVYIYESSGSQEKDP